MKKILVLMLLICSAPLIAAGQDKDKEKEKDVLHIQATLIRGERSRDSNSTVTMITVADNLLLYEKVYRQRIGKKDPERKQFKVSEKDKAELVKLVKDHDLLRTDQLERKENPSGISRYFSLAVTTDLNGKKGSMQLKGPRDAADIKRQKSYQDADALVKKIFAILGSADKTIAYQPPVD